MQLPRSESLGNSYILLNAYLQFHLDGFRIGTSRTLFLIAKNGSWDNFSSMRDVPVLESSVVTFNLKKRT